MTGTQIAIIGVGPRGLSVLQHISRLAHELPEQHTLDVHLIDPGEGGQGTHSSRQPPHLLTNTVASQVTMFTDGDGPSFTQWAAASGYRTFGTAFHPTGDQAGEAVGEHAYLPRQMLGRYLSWAFDQTVRSLPPQVRTRHYRDRAVDIREEETGDFLVCLEKGFSLRADYLFLTTGHCQRTPDAEDRAYEAFVRDNSGRNPRLRYLPTPYPVDRLQEISPDATVAVQGFGLTAHDVISELTVGRGGEFTDSGRDMKYHPTGREPEIGLFSRQCLPFSARGINQKGLNGQHDPQFFTKVAVQRLREQAEQERNDPRLDFEEEVLPLLMREMGYAYHTAESRDPVPAQEYSLTGAQRQALEELLDPLTGKHFADQDAFYRFFLEYLTGDLEHAELGNKRSPVKAATDVIRDTRESIREAVEFGGLLPEPQRAFSTRYVSVMNRISFGPPRDRNYQLLALMRAGVLHLAGGPGCRIALDCNAARFVIRTEYPEGAHQCHADALVIARLDSFHPERDQSPLVGNLLQRGLARPYANDSFKPGGLDIDKKGRMISASGEPLERAWAIGYLVEGPRFYTHALPRHGMSSQFTRDADISVRDMFAHIQRHKKGPPEDYHAGQARKPVSVP